ncbi:hypothetical protein [Leptolyngbya phage Lbo-JY46]
MISYKIYKSYSLGEEYRGIFPRAKFVDKISTADFVLLEDGPPPNPTFFGSKRPPITSIIPFYDNARDYIDRQAMEEAILCKIPIIGIGRGASILGLKAGTDIIQTYKKEQNLNKVKIRTSANTFIDSYAYVKALCIPYPYSGRINKYDYFVLSRLLYAPNDCKLDDYTSITPEEVPDIIHYSNFGNSNIEALGINSDPERIAYIMGRRQSRPPVREETNEIYKKMRSYLSTINGTIFNMVKDNKKWKTEGRIS